MSTTIEKCPTEMMELIFKQLSLKNLEKCVNTSKRWKEIAVHLCIKPHLKKLEKHEGFVELLDHCNDTEVILALYEKFKSSKPKVLIITGKPHEKM